MKLTTYRNLRFQRDSKPPKIVSNIAEHSIENNSAIAYLLKWRGTTTRGSQTAAPRSLLWLIFKPIAGAQRKKEEKRDLSMSQVGGIVTEQDSKWRRPQTKCLKI